MNDISTKFLLITLQIILLMSQSLNDNNNVEWLRVPTTPASNTTSTTIMSGDNCNGQTNSNFNDNNNNAALVVTKINIALDIIALQMVGHLEVKERNHHSLGEEIDKHNNVTVNSSLGDAQLPSQQRSHTPVSIQTGKLSMLLWAYAIVRPRVCPLGWEPLRRLERLSTLPQLSLSSLNVGLMEDGKSMELTENDDDFVPFDEFATNGRSDVGDYSLNNNHDTNVVSLLSNNMSQGNDNVDRLFDAVAITFCRE